MSCRKKATIVTDKNRCDDEDQEPKQEPKQKDGSVQVQEVSQSFWNRTELMNSVLFSLIRSTMMSAKPDIKKLRWKQNYSTVPVKNYYGDNISHP